MSYQIGTAYALETLGLLKAASPRWAREVDQLVTQAQEAHKANDLDTAKRLYDQAEHIATLAGADKPRQIRELSYGSDAIAKLMGGRVPNNSATQTSDDARGLFAAKFMGPAMGKNPTKFHEKLLPDRALVNDTIPSEFAAKNYGLYSAPSAGAHKDNQLHVHGGGGVEFQEYLPYEATSTQRNELAKAVTKKVHPYGSPTEGDREAHEGLRSLWDVADHPGNVRLDKDFKPKILDARYDAGSGYSTLKGDVHERFRQAQRQGHQAFAGAQQGNAHTVRPTSYREPFSQKLPPTMRKILRHDAMKFAPAALIIGGAAAYSHYNQDKEHAGEQQPQ